MTEAIVITAIIVGGLVAAFGIVVFAGFKAWKFEKIDAASHAVTVAPGAVSIHVDAEHPAAISKRILDREFRRYPSASN